MVECDPPAPSGGGVRRPPLLATEVQVAKEGGSGGFSLTLAPEAVVAKFTSVLDHGVRKPQGMPQLEAAVMEALFWAVVPTLNSVHLMEEGVQASVEECGGQCWHIARGWNTALWPPSTRRLPSPSLCLHPLTPLPSLSPLLSHCVASWRLP